MIEYYNKAPDCPEHPEEQLETTNLFAVTPPDTQAVGISSYMAISSHYCPQSKKYLSCGKLVSKEQAALDFINNHNYKRKTLLARIFKGKFKLNEIKVLTYAEYFKAVKESKK